MPLTTLIDTSTLASHLGDPGFVIVDCRYKLEDEAWGEHEYQAHHIPGAAYASLGHDLSGKKTGTNGRHPLPETGALRKTFGRLGITDGVQVIAYDQDAGMWAAVPTESLDGRREAELVKSFAEVPRDAERVIFFPRAAGGAPGASF